MATHPERPGCGGGVREAALGGPDVRGAPRRGVLMADEDFAARVRVERAAHALPGAVPEHAPRILKQHPGGRVGAPPRPPARAERHAADGGPVPAVVALLLQSRLAGEWDDCVASLS